MPLSWRALTPALDPRQFTIASAPGRLARTRDAWEGVMAKANSRAKLAPASRSGSSRRR
jgi:DNA primase